MNNNKISNPKTEVPSGIEMNEKDYLTCLLGILKELLVPASSSLVTVIVLSFLASLFKKSHL